MPKQPIARRKQHRGKVPVRALWLPVAAAVGLAGLGLFLQGDSGGQRQVQRRPAAVQRREPEVLAIQTEPVPIAQQMAGQTGIVTVVMTDQGFEPAVLRTKVGGRVKIYLRNEGSREQNFLLPRFSVVTSTLAPGGENYIEFTANAKGEWDFYSDQGKEAERTLSGILKVE